MPAWMATTLVVNVPDEGTRRWMESEYADEVLEAARRAGIDPLSVLRIHHDHLFTPREPGEFEAAAGEPAQSEIHIR